MTNPIVACDACGYSDCECGYTEEQKMAAAGMSDEEIANVVFIDRLSDQLDVAKSTIGDLLAKLDESIGMWMHDYGLTPSWYIEAAAVCAGIELNEEPGDYGDVDPETGAYNKPRPGDPVELTGDELSGFVLMDRLAEELSLDNVDTDFDREVADTHRGPVDLTEEELFMQDIRDHEALEKRLGYAIVAPKHIQLTINARRIAKQEGNCEDDRGDQNHKPDEECCDCSDCDTPPELRAEGLAAFMGGPNCVSGFPGPGVLADLAAAKPVRDCDVPATLRAIHLFANEYSNAYRLWFDNFELMNQFLAGRCFYSEGGGAIKDEDGLTVGNWYVAEFNWGGHV